METDTLRANIRKYRVINDLTQQEIADMLGVDRTTYSKYESGKANPQFTNVVKLAEIFGVTVGELCGSNDEELMEFGDSAAFSTEELRLVYSFRTLAEWRKTEILRMVNRLANDQEKDNEKNGNA